MAEFAYIDAAEAKLILPEPIAQIDSDTVILKAIKDASEEVNIKLREFGIKVDLPIAEKYRSEYFEIAVAYWTAHFLYLKHSQGTLEEAEFWEKKAMKALKSFYNITHWIEDAITEDVAVPSTVRYSNKGEVKSQDLTDPHDLYNET